MTTATHSDSGGLRTVGMDGGANDEGERSADDGDCVGGWGAIRVVAGLCGWLWELRGRLSGVADGGGAVLGMWTAVGAVRGMNGRLWELSTGGGRAAHPSLAGHP